MKESVIRELTIRPVIAAVRGEEDARLAAESPVAAVFLLGGSILTLADSVQMLREKGKLVFVHMDLCDGLGRDAAAVQWCARNLRPHGLISTRPQLLRAASDEGLVTIQRMFLMDSASLASGMKLSRARAAEIIRQGSVMVDHMPEERVDRMLAAGQLISVRGFGRVRLQEVGEPTRKDRLPIALEIFSKA